MRYRIWSRVNWGSGESHWVNTIDTKEWVITRFETDDGLYAKRTQKRLQSDMKRYTYVLVVD